MGGRSSPLHCALALPHAAQDPGLELQYRTCYARILDSKRRFLEAALRWGQGAVGWLAVCWLSCRWITASFTPPSGGPVCLLVCLVGWLVGRRFQLPRVMAAPALRTRGSYQHAPAMHHGTKGSCKHMQTHAPAQVL